jgi:hypothetical protein
MSIKTWTDVATASVSIIKTPNRYEWSVVKSDGEVVESGRDTQFRFALQDANYALQDYFEKAMEALGFNEDATVSTEETRSAFQGLEGDEIMSALMNLSIRKK